MTDETHDDVTLQDHAAYLAEVHDFQADIEILANSELVGTILETVMLATGMRFAAVARVTANRWVACRTVDETQFGLKSGDEIEIRSTFCQSVRDTAQKVLFNNSATDEVYANHPIALKFGISSYASLPIYRSDGSFLAHFAPLIANRATSNIRARWPCWKCLLPSSGKALRPSNGWKRRNTIWSMSNR